MLVVEYEFTPEPTEEERAAVIAALRLRDERVGPLDASAWRRAALCPDDEAPRAPR